MNLIAPDLNSVFHQSVRTRLGLLLYMGEVSFTQLKSALSITDGNLDAHLKKIGAAGFLHSRMVLEGRPHTVYSLSDSGSDEFRNYIEALSKICEIAAVKHPEN